jgi:phosphoesterase RecJ-like protein
MASALFVGIATDTGWFRYANATPRAFEIASMLCDGGAPCSKFYHLIYEQDPIERLRLLGKALATMSADADGQIIYFYVSHAVFQEVGVGESYTENFISYARLIRGGKIIILFKEAQPAVIHVSFRSKGDVDVRALARELGGGGHYNASGATAHGELQTVIRDVLSRARRALGLS